MDRGRLQSADEGMPIKNPSLLSLLTICVQVYLPTIEGHVPLEIVQAL